MRLFLRRFVLSPARAKELSQLRKGLSPLMLPPDAAAAQTGAQAVPAAGSVLLVLFSFIMMYTIEVMFYCLLSSVFIAVNVNLLHLSADLGRLHARRSRAAAQRFCGAPAAGHACYVHAHHGVSLTAPRCSDSHRRSAGWRDNIYIVSLEGHNSTSVDPRSTFRHPTFGSSFLACTHPVSVLGPVTHTALLPCPCAE